MIGDMMDSETEERLARLEARMRGLESAAADPWSIPPVFAEPPLPMPPLVGPVLLPDDVVEEFPAEIVTDATGGAYTFKEKYRLNATTWADLTGGRTGTCYESNDVAGIAVGKIIQIRVEYDTGGTLRYVFDFFSLPAADADYKVLQRKADDSIGFDWVRAH